MSAKSVEPGYSAPSETCSMEDEARDKNTNIKYSINTGTFCDESNEWSQHCVYLRHKVF